MRKSITVILMWLAFGAMAQPKWTVADAEAAQKKLNQEYADPKESPLTEEDLKQFKGLDFYPIAQKYAVLAQFVKAQNEKPFKMKTSTTRLPEYVKYGELHFELDGKKLKLNVYQNVELAKKPGYEDYLFLPFSDLTCGKESYIGGRYIDMRFPKSDTVLIDFNTAYNPYCAYNHKYSCPIVPLENDLGVAILAGVKKFHD
ncbi:DUF1684 domain-containing protein [Flavobacterium sp. CYK-4]|uniref:DUF1684 domain-containing protein n=1 Tax=Flavobacterium lotistagni TaxID=2709660 RepID=UPI00140C8E90|nr:DUF1684 domain-containing protein [Flavobacterium lotistagni]NHM07399.1 DUF1684 domain-containing protein [Flavobacterium lotistagni]